MMGQNNMGTRIGKAYVCLIFAFIFAPIAISILFSFSEARFPSLPLRLGSLEWYSNAWNSAAIRDAFWRSVTVAITVGAVSTLIGFTAAYTDYRYTQFYGKKIYLALGLTPPMVPTLVLGVGMLFYLTQFGLSHKLHSVIIGHVVLCTPFAMAVIRIRLAQMNPKLEEAAWNLGASRATGLRRVIIPFCWPAIAAAVLVCAAFSFDEFAIAWFVSGMDQTLPVRVLALIRREYSPAVNAIGSVTFVISMGLVIVAQLLMIVFDPQKRRARSE